MALQGSAGDQNMGGHVVTDTVPRDTLKGLNETQFRTGL